MERSYGVVWREGERSPITGKLELRPRAMRLEGRDGASDIPYEAVSAIRVGRVARDRVNGQPSIIVERRIGAPIKIATVAKPSVFSEIAERLAALQLSAQRARRVVVVLPIDPAARERVAELLEQGPPFDPESIETLDRHEVFLTGEEAVFIFESPLGLDSLMPKLASPQLWETAAAWRDYVTGPPRIAEEAYFWRRAEAPEESSRRNASRPGEVDIF
jgi:hypothetical protein